MTRLLALVAVLVVGALAGCDRSSGGVAVRAESPTPTATSSITRSITPSPAATSDTPVPGVEQTVPDAMPANALICFPAPTGSGTVTQAQVADPAAPRLSINVPPGWKSEVGQGDTALTLTGPDGMSGQVSIASTTDEPAVAFSTYGDAVFGKEPVAVLSVLPAEFCGFSSQRLFGSWGDGAGKSDVEFADRITHIWTNTGNYLVTIHLQGPAGAPGFDAAKTVLMEEFPIVIP